MTQHISRAQWEQITKRVKQAVFTFDPKWKCLIDGKPYQKCMDHNEEDNLAIIEEVRTRIS